MSLRDTFEVRLKEWFLKKNIDFGELLSVISIDWDYGPDVEIRFDDSQGQYQYYSYIGSFLDLLDELED